MVPLGKFISSVPMNEDFFEVANMFSNITIHMIIGCFLQTPGRKTSYPRYAWGDEYTLLEQGSFILKTLCILLSDLIAIQGGASMWEQSEKAILSFQ